MGARTGAEYLAGLKSTPRELWVDGERIVDVTADARLSGAAASLAAVFDRQHEFASDCLIPDPETGEPINISHMLARSKDDLRRRMAGLSRISEYTMGLMGRTPDYMNMKFASFAARAADWSGEGDCNADGRQNLVDFQKRLARQDIALTHTIIQPNVDKRTDGKIIGNTVTLHKAGETRDAIVVRGARILATLAPFADEIAVYPALPLPPGAEDYALSFSIPVSSPGLKFLARDSASHQADPFDKPLSTRFDEQDAFVIFDNVEIPKWRVFLDGRAGCVDIYNRVGRTGLIDNMTTQTTIRALNKLEFSYGLAARMAETLGDYSPQTQEMLGELYSYAEVARSALLCSIEEAYDIGNGLWFPGGRALTPMRSLLATWFPRVNEIITLIGSHNLLSTPGRAQFDNPGLAPLLDEFISGADGVSARERSALFRLAWDYIGSGLGGRNLLYERFYLTSAGRNRINAHLSNPERKRPNELLDSILSRSGA